MSYITKEIAKERLALWLEAEAAVASSQSYAIGTRSLTRANLSEIRKQIEYWQSVLARLENEEKAGGRNRSFRAVPRDL